MATNVWTPNFTIGSFVFGETFYGYNADNGQGSLSDYTANMYGGAFCEVIQWAGGSFDKLQIRFRGDVRSQSLAWDYVQIGSSRKFYYTDASIGYDNVENHTLFQWAQSTNPYGTSGTVTVRFRKVDRYFYMRLGQPTSESNHTALNGANVDRYDVSGIYPAYYITTEEGDLTVTPTLFRYNPDQEQMRSETVWVAMTSSSSTRFDPARPATKITFSESSNLSQGVAGSAFTVKGNQINDDRYMGVYTDGGTGPGSLISGRNWNPGFPGSSAASNTSYTSGVLARIRLWRISAPTIGSVSTPTVYDNNVTVTINLSSNGIGVTNYTGGTILSDLEYGQNDTNTPPALSTGGSVWFSSPSFFSTTRGTTSYFFARQKFNGQEEVSAGFQYTVPYLQPETSITATYQSQSSTTHVVEITNNSDENTTYIIRINGSGNYGQRTGNGVITVSDLPPATQTRTYEVWALLLTDRGGAGTLVDTGVTYQVTSSAQLIGPDPFDFQDVYNAATSTTYTSSVVLSGIDDAALTANVASSSNGTGQISDDNVNFGSTVGNLVNGDTLYVRATSASTSSTTVSTNVEVNGVTDSFLITTSSGGGGGGLPGGTSDYALKLTNSGNSTVFSPDYRYTNIMAQGTYSLAAGATSSSITAPGVGDPTKAAVLLLTSGSYTISVNKSANSFTLTNNDDSAASGNYIAVRFG